MSEEQTAIKPEETITTEYEVEPFYRKAMILGSPPLVQSIIVMPDSFVMPGFTLVTIDENTVCEPGMLYDDESGTFNVYVPPEPEPLPEPEEEAKPVTEGGDEAAE